MPQVQLMRQVQRAFAHTSESVGADREPAGLKASKSRFEELTGMRPEGPRLIELLLSVQ